MVFKISNLHANAHLEVPDKQLNNELQISVSTIFGKDPALQHNFGQLKTCSGAKYRYKAYFT